MFIKNVLVIHPLPCCDLSGASGYSQQAVHAGAVFLYQKATSDGYNDTGTTITASGGYTLQTTLMPADLHAYAYFGHTIYFRDAIGTCALFYFLFLLFLTNFGTILLCETICMC